MDRGRVVIQVRLRRSAPRVRFRRRPPEDDRSPDRRREGLLDTHVFLGRSLADARLSQRAREVIEDGANEIMFSPASAMRSPEGSAADSAAGEVNRTHFVSTALDRLGFEPLPVSVRHAVRAAALPHHHADPWDRLLVAQAGDEGMPADHGRCDARPLRSRRAVVNPSTTPSAATAPGKRTSRAAPRPKAKAKPKRRKLDPVKVWANTLRRYRPGLPQYVLGPARRALRRAGLGAAARPDERADPHDPHPEHRRHERRGAFEASARRTREADRPRSTSRASAGAARGCRRASRPTGGRSRTRQMLELIDVIRPGGSANQKAPRLQATLRRIREERGDYSLEFLGDMPALEARDWLTPIAGIGKKTASIVLLFCFGTPLMPVDRHVERVSRRIGLLPKKAHRRPGPRLRISACSSPTDVRRARAAHPSRPRDLPRPTTRARALSHRATGAGSWTPRRPDPGAASEAPHVRSARPCRRPPRRGPRRLARHGQRARPDGIRRTSSTTCPPTRSRAVTRTPRRSSPASTPRRTAA